MNSLLMLLQNYIEVASHPYLMIPTQIISFIVLTKIILTLTSLKHSQSKFHYEQILFVFFLIPIVAIMVDNIFWITKVLMPKTPLSRSINCLGWMLSCIKFHCLILFLEQLIHKKINWNLYHKIFLFLAPFI